MKPEDFYFLDERLSRGQKLRLFARRGARYGGATLLGMVGVAAIVTVVGGLYLGMPVIAMRTLGYVPGDGLTTGSGPISSGGVKPSTMP